MRVLVAGGSKFIGRHLVEFLLADGHEVTLFNRGQTNPGLFPDAAQVSGERAEPPAELGRHDWDWVFDLSCYEPAHAESLIGLVGPRTGRYVFCSTVSVYKWDGAAGAIGEEHERWEFTPENLAKGGAVEYGAKKSGCEDVTFRLAKEMGFEATVVRPVLVYGPWDPTDRWHWWLHRVKEGQVLMPAPASVVHAVYVKDLARIFMAAAKAQQAAGRVYNGAATRMPSLAEWVRTAAALLGREPRVTELPWEQIQAAGVQFLPCYGGEVDRLFATDRLEADLGFTATPFAQTIAESLAHMESEGRPIREAIDLAVLNRLMG